MQKTKDRYEYKGAVEVFGRPHSTSWKAATVAVSEKQAINNLKHQYRMAYGLSVQTPVQLVGRCHRFDPAKEMKDGRRV